MKTFLTLLLLIPSLSWGEVFFSCEKYKLETYREGLSKEVKLFSENERELYFVDNEKVYFYHNHTSLDFSLYEEIWTYDLTYDGEFALTYERINKIGDKSIIRLNRFTLQMDREYYIEDKLYTHHHYHCEKTEQQI